MQPGKMLCPLLYSYIFLLQSDYGQTRLNAHTDIHTHRGKQASIFCSVTHCLKLPSLAWFWLFFLPPCFSLPLHPSLFSPAHHVWPLFSFPFFLFLFLCCLSFLILHSSSFSLRQKNGPVKNKFKSIKCKNEKVSQISF